MQRCEALGRLFSSLDDSVVAGLDYIVQVAEADWIHFGQPCKGMLSCANESELLPSVLNHLRVPATEGEPSSILQTVAGDRYLGPACPR